jgi:phage recombination protein Bet
MELQGQQLQKSKELAVAYSDEKGQEIKLTADDVIKYISTDESVTEKEVVQFLNMCKYLKLNPFLKEIYLIKYKDSPATFVISYQTLLKRAEENKNFDGYETEVKGEIPDMTATAVVYRKDRSYPVKITVNYSETVKTVLDRQTKELRPTTMWKNMPEWMLRKVALARALKEAFPSAVGNAEVSVSEIVDIDTMDKTVIERRKNYKGDVNKDLYGIPSETKDEAKPEEAKIEEAKPDEAKTEPNPEDPESPELVSGSGQAPKLKLYELLKKKNITKLSSIKEILKSVFPNTNFDKAGKYIFENMPEEKISKVIEYLKETKE